MRRVVVLALLLLSSGLYGQTKVRLAFPGPGPRRIWVAEKYPESPPTEFQSAEGASFELPVGAADSQGRIFVWDLTSGNIADRALTPNLGSWKVEGADFRRIAQVRIELTRGGAPIAGAFVSAKVGQWQREAVLDAGAKGVMELFAVPTGNLQASIQVRTRDGQSKKRTISMPLSLSRDDPIPVMGLSITDDVATVAAQGSVPAGEASPPAQGGSFIGGLIAWLIGLAAIAGLIYGALYLLRAKGDLVKDKLTALGVQLPDQHSPAADPTQAVPAPTQPPERIILDDALPVAPIYGPEPISASPPPSASFSPRLVAESGETYDLEEGLTAIGRDPDLPVSLPAESTVSRRHAEIVLTAVGASLADLGSTNGTYVNGRKVEGEVELRPGDQVQFGAVKFRFET